jgi:pyruvate, orthophosphate dikinase
MALGDPAAVAVSGYVFDFAGGGTQDPLVLGGKGAGLAHMTSLGLPVPPGFTVSCQAGREFLAHGTIPPAAGEAIDAHLSALQAGMGRRLGDPTSPLLVSVRSGAPVSMPGMMDTVLNVGLNQRTVDALARETGDERFAWDCYQRFAEMYARVVRGVGAGEVEERLMDLEAGPDATGLQSVRALLALVEDHGAGAVPDDPCEQILEAIAAVFRSWNSPRARSYRRFRGIDDGLCTAATVQAMVFGNRGETSASGVAFTRDPSSGSPDAFGDVLFNAQGEDVVAGERDAEPVGAMAARLPAAFARLGSALRAIEADARDLSEVEFTVEEGTLWILQTRVGQRSGRAAVRVAVALVQEGVIAPEEAIDRITPAQLEAAASPGFSGEPNSRDIVGRGLAASPGAARGVVVFDASRAVELAGRGEDVVLVRPTTSPNDVAGFIAARGVVTGRGGRTSHAAVVARGMHRPAVCGVGEVTVGADRRSAVVAGVTLDEGERVSVDGDRGLLIRGDQALGAPADDAALRTLLSWCAQRRAVPELALEEVAELPVLADVSDLATRTERVLIDLRGPATVPASELQQALQDAGGRAPVLLIGADWLRAADVRLRGRVGGIVLPDDSPSGVLLQAVLTPDEPR